MTDAVSGDRALRSKIINGIKFGDSKGVHSLYLQRWNALNEVRMRNRLFDSLQYIENNFDSIDLDAQRNCSAEGHVSHVLSARLSSRPMGWSLAGAERIAQLRAFYFNGGDFTSLYRGREENTEEEMQSYNNSVRETYMGDHTIPKGRIVGLEAVYDEVGNYLRFLLKK